MASPSFRSAATNSMTQSGSVTINKPAGTASGDLLLAMVQVGTGNAAYIVAPAGWLLVDYIYAGAYSINYALYRKIAGGAEPASYTFTWDASGGQAAMAGIVAAFQNATEVELVAKDVLASGRNGGTLASLQARTAETLQVVGTIFQGSNPGSRTMTVTGLTERARVSANSWDLRFFDVAVASVGATPTRAWAGDTSDYHNFFNLLISSKPSVKRLPAIKDSGFTNGVGYNVNAPYLGHYASGGEEHKVGAQFDLSSIPAGAQVIHAHVRPYVVTSWPNWDFTVNIHAITAAWAEGNAEPAFDGTVRGSGVMYGEAIGHYGTFVLDADITSLVNEWVTGARTNNGLMFDTTYSGDSRRTIANREWQPISGSYMTAEPQLVVVYAQAPSQPGAFTAPAAASVHNNSVTPAWGAATDADSDIVNYELQRTSDNGSNWVAINSQNNLTRVVDTTAWPSSTTTRFRVRAVDSGGRVGAWRESATFTIQHNTAPTAPTNLSPTGGVTFDRSQVQRFSATNNDPDAGDTISAREIQYRLVGAGSWTSTGYITSTQNYHDFAASFFAAGNYEWQIRFKDSQGAASPWSASSFFTAATAPAGPAITSPANNSVIPANTANLVWTTPDQTAYEWRTVADNAGAPNTGTIYQQSGTVVSTTDRNAAVPFPTNNRYEHIQVRIRDSALLWSSWVSIRVQVSYTPPAQPLVITHQPNDGTGTLLVSVENPTPSGGQPAVSSNEIYKRKAGDTDPEGTRVAVGVAGNGEWRDWMVEHRGSYEYRAVAIGANGTSTSSAWIG